MFTGLSQSVVIGLVVLAFYAMDVVMISRYDRERQAGGSGRSWSFTFMVMAMAAFMVGQPVLWPWMGWRTAAWWGGVLQALGLVLIVGALALHGWARQHLRQFYAERIEVQPQHTLIDTGPYAHVRHPVFTSFFMCVVGLVLVNPALSTLLVAGYTFWDFTRAARQEDALLARTVAGYSEYMARTSSFVPRLGRRARGK